MNRRSCMNPWLHTLHNTNKRSLLAWLPPHMLLTTCRLTSPLSSLLITCALLPPSPPTIPGIFHALLPFCPSLTVKCPSLCADPTPLLALPPPLCPHPPPSPSCLSVHLQFKLSLSFSLLSKHHLFFVAWLLPGSCYPLQFSRTLGLHWHVYYIWTATHCLCQPSVHSYLMMWPLTQRSCRKAVPALHQLL